jgi:hypothetical protein
LVTDCRRIMTTQNNWRAAPWGGYVADSRRAPILSGLRSYDPPHHSDVSPAVRRRHRCHRPLVGSPTIPSTASANSRAQLADGSYQRSLSLTVIGPLCHSDGRDSGGAIEEAVPGVAGGVEDVVVGGEDAVREVGLAEVLPSVLDGVQFAQPDPHLGGKIRGWRLRRRCRGRRSSQVHRRGLQHPQAPFRARIFEPGTIRGSTRPADGQNRSLILSTLRGALHKPGKFTSALTSWNPVPLRVLLQADRLLGDPAIVCLRRAAPDRW